MKIALVLSVPPGYSETFFNSLIKGLQEEHHEVTLYTGKVKRKYDLCKHVTHPSVHKFYIVQVFLMAYRGLTLLPNFKTVKTFFHLERKEGTPVKRIIEKIYLNAVLLKFKGDWIHFGFATTALQRELVPKAVGAQMAVSIRGYDINVYPLKYLDCYGVLWRQVDRVHSISNYLLNKAYGLGLGQNKSFRIIHPAVDLKTLPKPNANQNKGGFKIVTIARFDWIKGLEMLTQVALILKDRGLDFEWVVIGTGNTSEKERYLFDVNEKQLNTHLIHKGQCSHHETLNILKDCDLYVQTSLSEGFCNAVLEAQALGVPCVAFDVGGLPENISHMKTGWLIEPYDVVAMSDKISDMSVLTPAEIAKFSQHAIKRVHDYFALEQQKQAFQEFYAKQI